ncbi:MAG TPA: hypothetical protein VGK32_15865 [Vicinamibacterales bacterium]|jgi:spore coat protein U-like protein
MNSAQRTTRTRPVEVLALLVLTAAVLALPAPAAAQSASAPLAVPVRAVRSCSVDNSGAPTVPKSPYVPVAANQNQQVTIRCGNGAVTYPVQPGLTVNPASTRTTVATSADGRGASIQF